MFLDEYLSFDLSGSFFSFFKYLPSNYIWFFEKFTFFLSMEELGKKNYAE